MMYDQMYETPEGFLLAKRLLLPDVRSFTELFTAVEPWSYSRMNHGPGAPEHTPHGGNFLDEFCSVRIFGRTSNSDGNCHLRVKPTQATLDAVVSDAGFAGWGYYMSWEVIEHSERGRCLVIANITQLISNRWLAYVDPASVPTPESFQTA